MDKEELQRALLSFSKHADEETAIDPSERAFLADFMDVATYEAGHVIMKQGEPASYAALVVSGRVSVQVDGTQVAEVGAGGLVGESAFVVDATRKADVTASEDTTLAVLSNERHEAVMVANPVLGLKLVKLFEAIWHKNDAANKRRFSSDKKQYIALVAHNARKKALVTFVRKHQDFFRTVNLVATGTTGITLFNETGVRLAKKVSSGPLGGDQAIGAMIAAGNIRAVIFFRDPLSPHPHQADIDALGRLSDVYQVPFATNSETAEAVVHYLQENLDDGQGGHLSIVERYEEAVRQRVREMKLKGLR